MADPVEYLKEAHRRAGRLAQAATAGPWRAEEHAEHGFRVGTADGSSWVAWTGAFDDEPESSRPDSVFIAANSPDVALARVTAERQILAWHRPVKTPGYDDYGAAVIDVCQDCSGRAPCKTVQLLAAGWGWTEET